MAKEYPKTLLDQVVGESKIPPPAPKKPQQAKDKEMANQKKPPFMLPAGGDGGNGKKGDSKRMKDKSLSFHEDRRKQSNRHFVSVWHYENSLKQRNKNWKSTPNE